MVSQRYPVCFLESAKRDGQLNWIAWIAVPLIALMVHVRCKLYVCPPRISTDPQKSFDMLKSLRIGLAFVAVQNLEAQKTLNPNNLNSKSLRIGSVFMHPVTST